MTFEEFRVYVEAHRHDLDWRPGQAAFNLLVQARPEIAGRVRGTAEDPFYVDDRLPAFWRFVEDDWDG